jgi:HNH endonuclease
VQTLTRMAGDRRRCYFCRDSRGADVDHFRPLSSYPDLTFQWHNLLLLCPECNRVKQQQFPLDADRSPLLLDPTRDDPWAHIFLEPDTAFLAPRYVGDEQDERGAVTLRILSPLNDEVVVTGRLRSLNRIRRAIAGVVDRGMAAWKDLAREVREDDFGLGPWFLTPEGSEELRVVQLRQMDGELWRRFAALVAP